MEQISFRVTKEEKEWIKSYAKVNGVALSQVIKDAIFEKLEDEQDWKIIREWEADPDKSTYSHEEIGKMLGLK